MEVCIRDLDPSIVKKLDELAHKAGLSRNKYLVMVLTNLSINEDLKIESEKYETLIKTFANVVNCNNEKIDLLIHETKMLQEAIYEKGEKRSPTKYVDD